MSKPVADQSKSFIEQCRPDAATAIVANHQDMFDLQYFDGELQYRQTVKIRVDNHVGHVPVNKKLPRQKIDDLVGGHAAVCATNPQVFRCLLIRQAGKKLRILGLDTVCPGPVFFQKMVKLTHYPTPFDDSRPAIEREYASQSNTQLVCTSTSAWG